MKRLIHGIVDFKKNLTPERAELFKKIALEQKPDALLIGCCDSRVVPNLFTSTQPDELFVLRNVGNLVPPSSSNEPSVAAALEFAIQTLKVSDIIVCGHSECGAMQALLKGDNPPPVQSWLKYGEASLAKLKGGDHNELSKLNVLQQIEHLKSYPITKGIRIHGWWFDIATADVYSYEKDRFVLIDQEPS